MFGDLSVSVISKVYDQNEGNVNDTITTLLNICQDEEALEMIRNLNQEEKKKLELEMQKEAENQRQESQRKMQLELEALRSRKEQEQKRREQEKLEIEKLQRQRKELEQTLREALAPIADPLVSDSANDLEKQRHLKELDQMQRQMAQVQGKIRQQEQEIQIQEQEMRNKEKKISMYEQLISKLAQEQAICTLSVRYSAKTIVVSWALSQDQVATPSDWVGFFSVDGLNTQYIEYIKTGGSRQGSHTFQSPKTPGLYEFRFFLNGSYYDVVRSGVINIGPQVTLSAALEQNKITCTWSLNSGDLSPRDWIGFYSSSAPTSKYLSIHYINPLSSSIVIDAPRIPGDYEFRFVPHLCSYTAVAKSDVVTIPNSDKIFIELQETLDGDLQKIVVTWDIRSVDVSRSDWIALYSKGKENNDYVLYKYVDKIQNVVYFDPPEVPGEYEFRYHSRRQSKYKHVTTSQPFQLKDVNVVTMKVAGPHLQVEWDIKTPKVTKNDWIALYKEGAVPTNYIAYKYVDLKENFVLFDKPADFSGRYFVRYFSYSMPKWTPLSCSAVRALSD
eukprot:TRINITY_DN4134_c0_g1_i1.p1 TRINITY_DN4134_c0_g1~~TRINITY_DN4134_c0_g1_i1.p1  ORF type:complete len:611 (-),score=154.72 TRINITY_DN4134_c0_g1_i1:40-1716(-)